MTRMVSWFSCGAASAVATKIALSEHSDLVIAYCEVKQEHPDNQRFLTECEEWFGQEILILGRDKYQRDIYEVFEQTGFLVGPFGAKCTTELKKEVRRQFQQPDDIQVFGYTAEETTRFDDFCERNQEANAIAPLIEHGIMKGECLAMVERAGIELPVMYKQGYHNNCIGCVKGQAGYWNKIRIDYPETFERMARVEEKLGRTICKREWIEDGERKRERIPLRELPPDLGNYADEPEIQCGIFCEAVEREYMTQKEAI